MIRRRRFGLFPIILWVLDHVPLVTRGDTLAALNNSFHAAELYSEVRNDERPPYVSEPHTDSDARMRLCSELIGNDYFAELGITPVDMSRPAVLRELLRRQNFWIFDLIYEGSGEESEREYSNRYHLRNFRVEDGLGKRTLRSFIFTTEWVFVCLVRKHSYTSTIVPYFVSREFDTGFVLENGRQTVEIAARFIFESTEKVQRIVMAEEPAVVYVNMDYNIEHHYIELKQDHPTANRSDKDPLCQMVPKGRPHNRHARLCASVLGSSYFSSTEIKKPPVKKSRDHCFRHPVSFQTDLGKLTTRRSITPVYYEWMIECKAVVARGFGRHTWISFYASRAYNSSQLFVYRVRLVNGDPRAYLENLSTRISFIDN